MRPISRFVYCDKSTGNNFNSITQSNKADNTAVFFQFYSFAIIDSKTGTTVGIVNERQCFIIYLDVCFIRLSIG